MKPQSLQLPAKIIRLVCFFLLLSLAFSCKKDPFDTNSGTFTDKRDGHQYKWVKIGEQIWMAENLAYVPYVCAPDSQCGIWVYDYNGTGSFYENYSTYGCLYDWESAMKVCPEGWRLPSDEDWMELERFLRMDIKELDRTGIIRGENVNAGGKLKEIDKKHWNEPNRGATNEVGFTALPGGYRSTNGKYGFLKYNAYFWTSSSKDNNATYRMITSYGISIDRDNKSKNFGLSVRCIKN
jgi:uncharacterized protein (TIGR02145 family)